MAVKFQIRGTQLDAWYAAALKTHFTPRQAAANAFVTSSGTSGIFGGSYIDMTNAPRIQYVGLDNVPVGSTAFSILLRVVPTFTGTPSAGIGLFEICQPGNDDYGGFSVLINTAGKMFVYGAKQHSTSFFFNSAFGTAINFVSGQPIDLWFVWDGTTGANKVERWEAANGNSATKIDTITASNAMDAFNKFCTPSILLWSPVNAVSNNKLHINEIVIFDTAEVPSSYGARAGFVTTTASAFEGYTYTDAGIANVRKNTTYVFQGNTLTGLAAIPGASDVRLSIATDQTTGALIAAAKATTKIGVAADDGTGLYDGSERYTDFGNSNIRLAQVGKFNSTTNNRTGTVVAAAAATTKIGTTADDGAGAYDGSERYTDFGNSNIVAGQVGKYNSTTNNRTGTGVLALAATTKHGITANDGTGSYRGYDLFDSLTAGQIMHGLTPKVDGTPITGTYRGYDLWGPLGASSIVAGATQNQDGVLVTGTRQTVTNLFAAGKLTAGSKTAILKVRS